MTDAIDLLQTKNAGITGVGTAPALSNYPTTGNIKALTKAVVLTWLRQATLDRNGVVQTSVYDMDVYVAQAGTDTWKADKIACQTLWKRFLTAYNLQGNDCWLQNEPAVRLLQGSLIMTGFQNVIFAPDGEPFHGFRATVTVSEHP